MMARRSARRSTSGFRQAILCACDRSPRRAKCNLADAGAPRTVNHAGNPAVLGTPVDRKLCALAFQRVCPDQTLCKIAQCEPQCQRSGRPFARFQYDLAHIRESFTEVRSKNGDACKVYMRVCNRTPASMSNVSGMRHERKADAWRRRSGLAAGPAFGERGLMRALSLEP